MRVMYFHIEERSAWIRTSTHTIVPDRDPDYQRFTKDPTGTVKRMLRIWLAECKGNRPCLRAYLGTFRICLIRLSFRELYRLFHLTSRAAKAAGESAKILRHNLANLLREYIREESFRNNLKE